MSASRRSRRAIRCFLVIYALSFLACGNPETEFLRQVAYGNRARVRQLLKEGVDPNARHPTEGTPALIHAVAGGDVQMAALLITNGADVNAKSPDGRTALMLAAEGLLGLDDMVRLLLARGADVNAKTRNGDTALRIAERMGNEHIAQLLRGAGAVE